MSLPDDFIFSQSALQDYLDCPRRFELRYIRDIRWPAPETSSAIAYESRQMRGQDFHHLLHQHAAGVDPQALESMLGNNNDDELQRWWENYLKWQSRNLPAIRHPELVLTTPVAGSLLMAKYDIVAKMPDSTFLIVDWKTGKTRKHSFLAERMQTLVYPYVLARSGDWLNDGKSIPPEKIKMLYWFADKAETVELETSAKSLESAEERLISLINEIAGRFEFPLTDEKKLCRFCSYRSLCERGNEPGSFDDYLTEDEPESAESFNMNLDEIGEISF